MKEYQVASFFNISIYHHTAFFFFLPRGLNHDCQLFTIGAIIFFFIHINIITHIMHVIYLIYRHKQCLMLKKKITNSIYLISKTWLILVTVRERENYEVFCNQILWEWKSIKSDLIGMSFGDCVTCDGVNERMSCHLFLPLQYLQCDLTADYCNYCQKERERERGWNMREMQLATAAVICIYDPMVTLNWLYYNNKI
jgi:hypothetical protein